MKIDRDTATKTVGLNTLGVASNVLLAGVVFGAISPWWLALSIPAMFSALGMELRKPERLNSLSR